MINLCSRMFFFYFRTLLIFDLKIFNILKLKIPSNSPKNKYILYSLTIVTVFFNSHNKRILKEGKILNNGIQTSFFFIHLFARLCYSTMDISFPITFQLFTGFTLNDNKCKYLLNSVHRSCLYFVLKIFVCLFESCNDNFQFIYQY